jgi:nucleoside-diphosphate-sugar epimerase
VLTDVMARSEMLSPTTDDLRMHNAVGAFNQLTDLLFGDHARVPAIEHAESAYMHVALQTVIEPDKLAEVPVAKLSGATLVTPGRPATERDELIAAGPIAARITTMRAALAAADRGIRSCLVMLPRSVHGQGERHGFIPQLITAARAKGVCGYIGDGASRWPAVHVKDAASLYRLAIEQAPAGAVLNAVGDEGVPIREIAEAIGRHLNLPARSLPAEEFGGMLVHLLSTDMPASSTITQDLLGWKPTHPGLIEDIEQGHYFR